MGEEKTEPPLKRSRVGTKEENRSLLLSLLGAIVVGVFAAILHGVRAESPLTVIALVVLIGGASGLCGTVLGFLFGIPRTSVDDGEGRGGPGYRPNTSLEQISDWLTKILVGVGLTQISDIPGILWNMAADLAEGQDTTTSFILAVVLYSGSLGFLFGYIATRVYMAPLFRNADAHLAEKLERAQAEVDRALEMKRSVIDISREMMQRLYDEPPQGFERAITLGESLLGQQPASPVDEGFWLRLACAYAQRHKWEKEQGLSAQAEASKLRAFDAMDRMIGTDTRFAAFFMRLLSDPNFPKAQGEDDFEVFQEDPAFVARMVAAEAKQSR